MKSLVLSIVALLLIHTSVHAQEEKKIILRDKQMSFTIVKEEHLDFLETQKEALAKFERPSSMGMIEVPLQVHVIRSKSDPKAVSIDEIKTAIAKLNTYFVHIYVRFVPLGDFNYIPDDDNYIFNPDNENSFCSPHDTKNVINLYIVGDISYAASQSCGYTHLPTSLSSNIDRVFISKDCIGDGVSLARQMGHYFTLFATAGIQNAETNELVDGSNCKTEGDQICDTPADPGLTLATVDERCGYIGRKQDQSGKKRFYRPDTHNLMSDNPRLYCCTHFTQQQYTKMMFAALNIRNYLTFPKSGYSKKQLRILAEEKGIKGKVEVSVQGIEMTTTRDKNLYLHEAYTYPAGTPYKITITNYNRGYVYVLEGDRDRGVYLQYPQFGDKVYFKGDAPATFSIPSADNILKVDGLKGADGKNHLIVLFSKKQLRINELIEQMNALEADIDVVQRIYTILGVDLIPSKNLTYDKKGTIEVAGIATDQQIMPVIIEYKQQ